MIWADNMLGHARLGLLVPKARQTAVARNRLRRRLKELWRREIRPRQPACDVVVRTRSSAYSATFAQLRVELGDWLRRIGA